MAPAFATAMMDATTTTVKKPRQTRNVQPEIDPSIPLHPWASTSKLHQASYRPVVKSQPQPAQPQPQYAMSMHPPQTFPVAVAPIPTASFYAQPQPPPHTAATYVQATPVPSAKPEPPQPVAPAPALPKKNLPTRADLDFLLGGSSRARAGSSAPNATAKEKKPRATAAKKPGTKPRTYTARKRKDAQQLSEQTDGAGPSRLPALDPEASTLRLPLQDHDDDLPLGAEAVMESDHEAGSSFEADNEAEGGAADKDDPTDRDFRPGANAATTTTTTKRKSRLSQASDAAAAASGTKKRARRSLASTSTTAGKVAGSNGGWLTPDGPRRRGRPPKVAYTPDVIEQMKVANEMLGITPDGQEAACRKNLRDIIDPQTRQALSPEMRVALLRARNTQLQRERLRRLREAGLPRVVGAKPGPKPKPKQEPEVKEDKPKRTKKRAEARDDEMETGSGSAILERAKGKVSEWIKSISSEAELSADAEWDDMLPPSPPRQRARIASSAASSRQRAHETPEASLPPPPPPASAPAPEAAVGGGDLNIDPRLFDDSAHTAPDDELVHGYFSRFATVTGDAHAPKHEHGLGGVEGDEYYFSN
ncbi:conserved hypothetical protein [Sporisorium reilianum SRZ2]|uniref:Uncharacterized protein n=1 Tax=Sporisorium reilianum (strain SRZ2) TaxID=999809 RepID=E7A346_SPORE|nr:conserved hypothetical protein [Sporisorium reilianum SRZ2]